jgi:putative peptidoglycan lipid II flippase
VAAAELPAMASHVGTAEEIAAGIRKRLTRGLRQMAFFVIPTTVAFVLIGRVLVAALYQRGKFTQDDTAIVWYILIGSSIGLVVATLGRLYSSTYYALGDTRTPMRIAIARVLLGGILAYAFAFPLRPLVAAAFEAAGLPPVRGAVAFGAAGITAASGFAAWLEFALLRRGIQRRIGKGEPLFGYYGKVWAASFAAGAAAFVLERFIGGHPIVEALLVCAAFGIIYFVVAAGLRVPEVSATLSRFRR